MYKYRQLPRGYLNCYYDRQLPSSYLAYHFDTQMAKVHYGR